MYRSKINWESNNRVKMQQKLLTFQIFSNRWKILVALLLINFLVTTSESTKKRVCIVGAGVSGLVATKYFSEYPNEFEPVVFEKNSNVGGLWIYTDSTTVDEHGLLVHSSIYKNLRTNAAKELMTFPDYPHFGNETSNGRVMRHEDVLGYLRNYTDYFNLRQYIQFNSNVEKVDPLPDLRWQIVIQNLDTKTRSETTCDAVLICNGHDVKGYVPKISGIESFTGQVLHSHVYRKPDPFVNQTVVVLGASFSGIDISVDISPVARKVYLSHRHDKIHGAFPTNIEQVPGVIGAEVDKLVLSNGTKISADALIYCTGYVYDFPFLDESSGISVQGGKYIRSIYKQLINIERPTMAIMNVPQPGLHFQAPHAQVNYFRAVLRGELSLPIREQMLIEAQLPANVSTSKAHVMPYNQYFDYFDELVLAAGGHRLPWWFPPAVSVNDELIFNDPVHFKDKRLIIHEDNHTVEYV